MCVFTVQVGIYAKGETVLGVFPDLESASLSADVFDGEWDYIVVEKWDTANPKASEVVYKRSVESLDAADYY